ncbi:phosphoserine phosphatase SCDLUD_004461 [Saccharomycodes ludwigii]|uniref:phosphoserine phosphatase n=1 Tax=Saccharomycodes ludwigii TaxID=36035 RepID=UPI001E85E2C4|nr:hypothetical protein SCDLUD_004461 [Saccharomycodes ludwigii]KAH3899039.1 hypothetical protein SCDLUD_004461 [Saccharomycodes ludwigii]
MTQSYFITCISNDIDKYPLTEKYIDKFINDNKTVLEKDSTVSDVLVLHPLKAIRIPVNSNDLPLKYNPVEVSVNINNYDHFKPKLMVFDMDSTLIYQEVIELIAKYANVEDKVRDITTRAMNNELNFKQSLKERVSLLKGIELPKLLNDICENQIVLTKGVRELIYFLQNYKSTVTTTKTAVLSGGFIPFAKYVQNILKLDYMRANELGLTNHGQTLDGTVIGEIVDGQYKAKTLVELASINNIDIKDTCMVGDGGNDLPAMKAAGYGIAWNAKPIVQQQAPCKLNSDTILDILYIFGFTKQDIDQVLSSM